MKHFTLSVPILIQNFTEDNRKETLRALRRCGAHRVFLGVSGFFSEETNRRRAFGTLPEKVAILQDKGFEVGVWVPSSIVCDGGDYTFKQNAQGQEMRPWQCHADESFIRLAELHMRLFAQSGISLIMFDDDFHHSHYDFGKKGLRGCSCPCHQELMRKLYGDDVDFNTIMEEAANDKPNASREKWMAVMAHALETYASRCRHTVNEINPNIRMGIASCVSNHGIEGSSLEKLSTILAGKNKPFMRLIGAPYWYDNAYGGRRDLGFIIEVERWQNARYKKTGIETMGEGDVFPRPRTAIPASILECMDTALRADGGNDGILKYMIPYYSHANYENGYINLHCENKPLYKAIAERFSEMPSVGIRIYTNNRIFTKYDLSYAFMDNLHEYKDSVVFPQAGRILSKLSLPTTYDGIPISTAVFGEYGRFVEMDVLKQGTLLDFGAAQALTSRGIDVGLRENQGRFPARAEDFGHHELHRIMQPGGGYPRGFFRIRPDEKANVLSWGASNASPARSVSVQGFIYQQRKASFARS